MAIRGMESHVPAFGIAEGANVPIRERVLDRLADLLFDADEILGMIDGEDAGAMRRIVPRLRRVYEEVNALMQELAD